MDKERKKNEDEEENIVFIMQAFQSIAWVHQFWLIQQYGQRINKYEI